MNSKSEYLKIFSEVIPVKGYRRALIYDLIRSELTFVPNSLVDFLNQNKNKSMPEVYEKLNESEQEIADKYLRLLIDKEYIFFCDKDEVNLFKEMNLKWDYPARISNSIIKLSSFDILYLNKTVELISTTHCKNILLIIDFKINLKQLEEYYSVFKDSRIINIELLFLFEITINNEKFQEFLSNSNRLTKLVLNQKPIEIGHSNTKTKITYSSGFNKEKSFNKSIYDFLICIPFFTESQYFNTYFNRKIYFEQNKFVKNSPESPQFFPYPNSEIELNSIISSSNFKELWSVKKDNCDVCKDCEFRHMCQDNRVPQKRNEKEWFFREECNYNPYICKWKGEEGYKTLEECGVISNENSYSRDGKKIATINKILWEEETENA